MLLVAPQASERGVDPKIIASLCLGKHLNKMDGGKKNKTVTVSSVTMPCHVIYEVVKSLTVLLELKRALNV